MPKALTTTVSPSPSDVRVIHLEQLLNVSRAHAVGVVTMSWAMMLAEESEGVVTLPVTILDKVVDIEGAGQALVDAGLVGVEPAGLVLPLGVRQASDRAKRKGLTPEERDREGARKRKTKSRRLKKLTSPSQASGSKTSPPTAEAPAASCKPRRLGTVEGRSIMLLYRHRDGVPFYKLQGASPMDFTGTVTDPEKPTLADAFVALMSSMRREQERGLQDADSFRPTMKQMVDAAYRHKAEREASEAVAARREQANQALAEASAEGPDDHDHDGPKRDAVTPVSRSDRDTVTCHAPVTPEGAESVNGSPCKDRDLGADVEGSKCHAPCHNAAPSSSSSFSSLNESRKENTTTTSSVTSGQCDRDDILEGFVRDDILDSYVAPPPSAERVRQLERFARFAEALGTTVDAVEWQYRHEPGILAARLKAACIDLKTGHPVGDEAASKPVEVRDDIDSTSDTTVEDKPAAGSVDARGDDIGFRRTTESLNGLGIPRAVNKAPPPDEDQAFEDNRLRVLEQLVEGA